jgi:hypothetical protein
MEVRGAPRGNAASQDVTVVIVEGRIFKVMFFPMAQDDDEEGSGDAEGSDGEQESEGEDDDDDDEDAEQAKKDDERRRKKAMVSCIHSFIHSFLVPLSCRNMEHTYSLLPCSKWITCARTDTILRAPKKILK